MRCHLVPRSLTKCTGHSIQVPQDKEISIVSLHIYDTLMITNCKPVVNIQRNPVLCVKILKCFSRQDSSRDKICARSIILCDFLTFSFILSSTPNLTKRKFSLKLPSKHFYVLYCMKAMEFFLKKQAQWHRRHPRLTFQNHFFRTLA